MAFMLREHPGESQTKEKCGEGLCEVREELRGGRFSRVLMDVKGYFKQISAASIPRQVWRC